jgi:hypothetical protein
LDDGGSATAATQAMAAAAEAMEATQAMEATEAATMAIRRPTQAATMAAITAAADGTGAEATVWPAMWATMEEAGGDNDLSGRAEIPRV